MTYGDVQLLLVPVLLLLMLPLMLQVWLLLRAPKEKPSGRPSPS